MLRVELRKTDCHGFEFLVFLMKNYTQSVHANFRASYGGFLEGYPIEQRHLPEVRRACIMNAFQEYIEH